MCNLNTKLFFIKKKTFYFKNDRILRKHGVMHKRRKRDLFIQGYTNTMLIFYCSFHLVCIFMTQLYLTIHEHIPVCIYMQYGY